MQAFNYPFSLKQRMTYKTTYLIQVEHSRIEFMITQDSYNDNVFCTK